MISHGMRVGVQTIFVPRYCSRSGAASCACCTRTGHPADAVLLSPIVLMLFAILETFILLSVSVLLCTVCTSLGLILY